MSKLSEGLFKDLDGWEPVDPDVIEEVKKEMQSGVQNIVDAVEERRQAALASRGKPLKY